MTNARTSLGGLEDLVDRYRRAIILATLQACDGNVNAAARVLRVHRNTITRWTDQLGLPRQVRRPRGSPPQRRSTDVLR